MQGLHFCYFGNITLSNYSCVTRTTTISTKELNKRLRKQRRFWIVGVKNSLRSIKKKRITCRKDRAQLLGPVTAEQPTGNLDASIAFANVGVDHFVFYSDNSAQKSRAVFVIGHPSRKTKKSDQ